MSQDKVKIPPKGAKPPVYQQSFVGIWKRMFVSGRPETRRQFLFFNAAGSCYGAIGSESRIGNGVVQEILPDADNPQNGTIKIKLGFKTNIWTYTLTSNNEFKAQFNPIGKSDRTPPKYNQLLLVGQGARHLYAFYSHPFRPLMTEQALQELL